MSDETKKAAEDPTRGVNSLFTQPPTVDIDGQHYPMRRLGLADAMLGLKIFAAASGGVLRLLSGNESNATNIGLALVAALPYAEDSVVKLLAGVMQIPEKDLRDPSKFPLPVFTEIIEKFSEHPDLKAFMDNVGKLKGTSLFKEIVTRTQKSAGN